MLEKIKNKLSHIFANKTKIAVFISYRRKDSSGFAGRLSDYLKSLMNPDLIFIDTENIQLGKDFIANIFDALQTSKIFLLVIGPNWNDKDSHGNYFLDNENDFVRIELSEAIRRKIVIWPILLNNGVMPKAETLPIELRQITRIQAVELRHEKWKEDLEIIKLNIKDQIPELISETTPTSEKISVPRSFNDIQHYKVLSDVSISIILEELTERDNIILTMPVIKSLISVEATTPGHLPDGRARISFFGDKFWYWLSIEGFSNTELYD